jgi:hypothetical protein
MSAGPEDILQMQVARYLNIAAPNLVWFHPANGGYRNPREAKKLKDMGVKPGVADLAMILPDGRAAFIELKAGKNGLENSQKAFRDLCAANSIPYAVCRSLEDVDATLRNLGVPLRARSPE